MKLKEATIVFNALSDETRLRIISLLGDGELCVCDLMRVLQAPQSKISRHLAYLRRAKLVIGRKEGLWMHYRLSKPGSKNLKAVLNAVSVNRSDFEELNEDMDEFNKKKSGLVACCK